MKTIKNSRKPDASTAILACDVSNLVASFHDQFLEREFANRTAVVETQLALMAGKFRNAGCQKFSLWPNPPGITTRF